jgi:predicted membrane-bound spermidine synthase
VGKFLLLQGLLAGYAALSLWALVTGVEFVAALRSVRDYLGSYEPIDFYFDFTAIAPDRLLFYLAVPAALILPPTLLMGVSFTFLQRAVQSNVNSLGRRLGWLQAMNIFGCTAGAVVVGIVLLHRFGTVGTLRVLVALSVVFWVLYFRRTRARVVATVLVGAAAALVPAPATLWARLHGTQPGDIIHGEDGTGLSVLRNEREDFWFVRVFVNGLGQSWIPFHGVHTYLGLVPVLVHPEPRTIACIGLGSGDTAFALGGRPETQQVHCIEIIGSQLATLRALHDKKRYEGLGSLLGDARYQHVVGDGRRFLMHGGARFDIIEADALRPTSAYAGNLYSREYFELLRAHLQPHGLAVTWMPTERVYHTFVAVFPHVVQVEPMLLGSNEPIVIDKEAIRARAARPEIKSYYLRAGIDITPVVEEMLAAVKVVDKGTPAPASAHNTDLFPRDELYVR